MKNALKIAALLLLLLLIAGGIVGYYLYNRIYQPNVSAKEGQAHELFIPTKANFSQIIDSLSSNNILKNTATFQWVAEKMNYPNKIYPGRYLINEGLNNRELVNLLRSGKQTPYDVVIHNVRTKDDFISLVSSKLEVDSTNLAELLSDSIYLAQKGFTPENVITIFISDTYRFNWNTDEKTFFERMLKEYRKFWNETRLNKAKKQELTAHEVINLASIVEEETAKHDEMPRVAGVYLNRLKKGWALQADPTVKFAVGDFALKRILNKHLAIDSPYNTYKYTGLPPGPIRIPSKKALESVLNPEEHKYMYFCAKEDFSGYHNFAKTLREHNLNAKRYHKALNKLKIK